MSNVDHPDHYNQAGVECIDIIEGTDLNFTLGNALKYIWRSKSKGREIEDLQKAIWYLERDLSRRRPRLFFLRRIFQSRPKITRKDFATSISSLDISLELWLACINIWQHQMCGDKFYLKAAIEGLYKHIKIQNNLIEELKQYIITDIAHLTQNTHIQDLEEIIQSGLGDIDLPNPSIVEAFDQLEQENRIQIINVGSIQGPRILIYEIPQEDK